MAATKRAQKVDSGLQEIENRVKWFIAAHTERLAALDMDPVARERELATIVATAAAIRDRMTGDYLTRRRQ